MNKKFLSKFLLLLAITLFPLELIGAQSDQPVSPDNPKISPGFLTLEEYAILPGQGLEYGTPSYNSVAVSPHDGHVYISYYNAQTNKLALASEAPGSGNCGTGNNWLCRDLTTSQTDDMGRYSSIAFGLTLTSWKLGISFYDQTNYSLWFYEYSCVGSNCTTSIDRIDQNVLFNTGSNSSLKYDLANGVPMISYYAYGFLASSSSLNVAYKKLVGEGNCGPSNTWQCDTIDSTSAYGLGKYNSLAQDQSGYWHISYYDEPNGRLKYAKYVGGATGDCGPGNIWDCWNIDGGPNDVGLSTSLVLESGTKLPRIAYYDKTAGKLRFAKHLGGPVGNCGIDSGFVPRWYCQDIETIGDFTTAPAIATALFWTNNPHIVYEFYDGVSPSYVKETIPNPWSNGNCGYTNWNCTILAAGGNAYTGEGESVSVVYRNLYMRVIVWDEYDDYYSTRALRILRDFEVIYLPLVKKE